MLFGERESGIDVKGKGEGKVEREAGAEETGGGMRRTGVSPCELN